MSSERKPSHQGSAGSNPSYEILDSCEGNDGTLDQELDFNSPLVRSSIVNDHALLQLLEERVKQDPGFKGQLLTYIELSKKDKKWRKAAANAITLLIRTGEQFIGADLKSIRIPGADLSYGVFDSAQLQNADLRKVNFRGVWLRQTDLGGAQLTGAQFGELPYLIKDDVAYSCVYSPDGESFAVGFSSGNIDIYSTVDWKKNSNVDRPWRRSSMC